ncbi:OmpA family protein [Isoptericola halotolerans]|uniref:Outer membrane protein OmpA-like peptidoglycan-associated protein n=1 Tax=Isoptericola halotolerans TaxID=300560 RepID=A0ABX2A2M5_9MICO|nr:outer membrane protein OmpA-like peptidoglycan-associated protein [Isoptericola halotolerans]
MPAHSIHLAAALTLAFVASTPSTAEWPTPEELGFEDPTPREIAQSIVEWSDPGRSVTSWADPARSVHEVQTVEQEDEETVVTLSSDILFDPSESELSDDAVRRVGELVADIPQDATVKVHGHTDTVDTAEFNQGLSERRADAVAAAIEQARDDLDLDVEGFGESRLKVDERGDEDAVAEAREQNRRVELRYEG